VIIRHVIVIKGVMGAAVAVGGSRDGAIGLVGGFYLVRASGAVGDPRP
jgi:hypothetical protein